MKLNTSQYYQYQEDKYKSNLESYIWKIITL